MEKYESNLNLPYYLMKNVLSPERCAELVIDFEKHADPTLDSREGYSHYGLQGHVLRGKELSQYSDIKDLITVAYNHFLDNYEMKYNTFELKRTFGNVMGTGADNPPHDDDGDVYPGKPNNEEHYSCILMLNSDYEGGELYFPLHDIEVKLEAGDFIMFRGNSANLHGIKKISSGKRVNMVIFFRNYYREFPMDSEESIYPW